MKYNFKDEVKIPKSIIDKQEREKALLSLKDGVSQAVSEIEKPLQKIAINIANDSVKQRDFEKSLQSSVINLENHIKENDKKVSSIVKKQSAQSEKIVELLKDQNNKIDAEYTRDKVVKVANISDIDIPEMPEKLKVEFLGKQEVFGKVDTGIIFPDVQMVKFEKEPKPPVINIVEKIIDFPKVQVVELKDKIPAPIVNVEKNEIKFPPVQKVEFKKIPTVKISNQKDVVKVSNLSDIKFNIPDKFLIDNLPIAKGHKPSVREANPEIYIPVRLTDGNKFIDAIGGGSQGGTVMGGGQSLPQAWITSSGTVGTSSSILVAQHQLREIVAITNDSVNIIYLSFGEDAKIGAGIRLNELGGSYEINKNNLFKGNIFAISAGSNSNVAILEVNKTLN